MGSAKRCVAAAAAAAAVPGAKDNPRASPGGSTIFAYSQIVENNRK